ncbi:MAG: PDZ domain-containing protein [Muribaculaceae bacterium]|nr:PDZ domain-containing protein [Muribaculaceae bacterium]
MAAALIQGYYVEDVDGQKLADEAITAMLKTLDPHSSYSDPEETKELTQPLEGKFSGIGIQFNAATDTVYVIQTVTGGPSEKVGIRPGDRFIQADDSIIAGRKLPNSAILKILRGEKGSKVNLKVKRGGEPELLDFVVIRDDIPIYSVDASYMANDSTGYIRVSRFAEDTADEVALAVAKLQ